MSEQNPIYMVADDIVRKKLGLGAECKAKNMTSEIMNLFILARMEGKRELTIDEVTAAYYNMVTKENNGKIKTKKEIALKLFNMKGGKKNNGQLELVPGTRGVYRIREKSDDCH